MHPISCRISFQSLLFPACYYPSRILYSLSSNPPVSYIPCLLSFQVHLIPCYYPFSILYSLSSIPPVSSIPCLLSFRSLLFPATIFPVSSMSCPLSLPSLLFHVYYPSRPSYSLLLYFQYPLPQSSIPLVPRFLCIWSLLSLRVPVYYLHCCSYSLSVNSPPPIPCLLSPCLLSPCQSYSLFAIPPVPHIPYLLSLLFPVCYPLSLCYLLDLPTPRAEVWLIHTVSRNSSICSSSCSL